MALQSVSFHGCEYKKTHLRNNYCPADVLIHLSAAAKAAQPHEPPKHGGSSPAQIVLLIAHSLNGGNGLQCKEMLLF